MSTLNKMTKAQLIEHAAAQGREIVSLREQLSIARAAAHAAHSDVDVQLANWPTAARVRAERQLPAHFVAAREAAMRLGRAVKIGA